MKEVFRIFIGYDTCESDSFEVCKKSLLRHSSIPLLIEPLEERRLRHAGLYTRSWIYDGGFQDVRDGKPFSTEFSFTRFLVPALCQWRGKAIYCDCDFLMRDDIFNLFKFFRYDLGVMVVKHQHEPEEELKMEGQKQTRYYRKNWSSLILWNCGHPANMMLTPDRVSSSSGQWLHAFSWLENHEIGELPEEWNWLSGVSRPGIRPPKAVHFTKGVPTMPGCDRFPYADEWFGTLQR